MGCRGHFGPEAEFSGWNAAGEKPLGARERTNNKLNPHMASTPGVEPGPHWWEASALNTAPPLLPKIGENGFVIARQD